MIWLALIVIAVLVSVIAMQGVAVRRLGDHIMDASNHDHRSCVASIGLMVSTVHSAEALEEAARDYDSIEEQGTMQRLAREHYQPGGPSMPTIWLLDRAAQMRSKAVGE